LNQENAIVLNRWMGETENDEVLLNLAYFFEELRYRGVNDVRIALEPLRNDDVKIYANKVENAAKNLKDVVQKRYREKVNERKEIEETGKKSIWRKIF